MFIYLHSTSVVCSKFQFFNCDKAHNIQVWIVGTRFIQSFWINKVTKKTKNWLYECIFFRFLNLWHMFFCKWSNSVFIRFIVPLFRTLFNTNINYDQMLIERLLMSGMFWCWLCANNPGRSNRAQLNFSVSRMSFGVGYSESVYSPLLLDKAEVYQCQYNCKIECVLT